MPRKRSIEDSLKQKLREPRIVYLLGAGASFCAGLPGILGLTERVQSNLGGENLRIFEEIKQSLVSSGIEEPNIEDTLSELSILLGATGLEKNHKIRLKKTFQEICYCITDALKIDSTTEYHKKFVQRLVSRRQAEPAGKAPPIQIFTVNYDLLVELACEESDSVVINGFEGIFHRKWNPGCFDMDIGKATDHVQKARFEPSARHVRLYKLHGSLSWLEESGIYYEKPIQDAERIPLIIYPSRRKYAESIRPPFEWLLRRFGETIHDARLLVCIGYGFGDSHLNQYIAAALSNGLSLMVLSKERIDLLSVEPTRPRISIINEEETIIDGNDQNEITNLWDFKEFAKWLPALKEK